MQWLATATLSHGEVITYLVNSSQGLAASYKYDAYGNLVSQSGSLAGANVYRFSSKEWLATPGLYYYGYRWYAPNLQRWLNRDPVGERFDRNLYRFAYNQAVSYIDPNGLWGIQIGNLNIGWGNPTIAFSGNYIDDVVMPFWGYWATWNSSVDEDTFEELAEAGGAYIHDHCPVRGAYFFAGPQIGPSENLGLLGYDVADGPFTGWISALEGHFGNVAVSVGNEQINGGPIMPIVLVDLHRPGVGGVGGFWTYTPNGHPEIGLYGFLSLGPEGSQAYVGGGFYFDWGLMGNLINPGYWLGHLPTD